MTTQNDRHASPRDPIGLLYLHDPDQGPDVSGFTREAGFVLDVCSKDTNALVSLKTGHPDLIIVESLDDRFGEDLVQAAARLPENIRPGVLRSLHRYPDLSERRAWGSREYDDWLIRPFSPEDVKQKADFFTHRKNKAHAHLLLEKKIRKTTEYLNRFEQALKQAKSELYEERVSLNHALKQINQLTKERTRLKKDIRAVKTGLMSNMDGIAGVLTGLIRVRVEKNRGHSERVARIAGFVADGLGLDEKRKQDLSKAATLHEVGLLLLPENLVGHPDTCLSEYEKDLLDQYPVKGADLLAGCPEFSGCADIIRHLNENADGTGRPQGLKKKDIPLASRILAGADLLDSLKDRPDLLPVEALLGELETYSGGRLDPSVVAWLEKFAVLEMGSDAYRVRGVGIHQLEPGMSLGAALFTHTGTKLFSANTLLTSEAIDKIKKYNTGYPVDETVYIRA